MIRVIPKLDPPLIVYCAACSSWLSFEEEDIKPLPMWLHSIDTRYHITCPKCAATVFVT